MARRLLPVPPWSSWEPISHADVMAVVWLVASELHDSPADQ